MQNEMNLANDSFIATISNQGVILKDQIFYIQVQPLIRKKLEFKVNKKLGIQFLFSGIME